MTILFLILLGLFLTLAAFSLDVGNLYLWRLRLDKAARAGTLAGLGFRGVQGWTEVRTVAGGTALINATRQAVQDNLSAYGLTLDPAKIIVTYNATVDAITVRVNHSPPTILVGRLSKIFGFGFNAQTNTSGSSSPLSGFLTLSIQHQATLNRANVALLIDVSGSMLCPAPGQDPALYPTPCSCRRYNACGTATTKLDKLADGVERFAKHFNPHQDRISVIAFNLAAQQLYSVADGKVMREATSTHPLLAGTTAFAFLTNLNGRLRPVLRALAGSNTNHCDALAEGIRELELLSVNLFGNDDGRHATNRRLLKPFVVLFTDGAPSAMRGIFAEAAIPADTSCATYTNGVRTAPGRCSTNDFYHYALEWAVNDVVNNVPTVKTYRGPGPFVTRTIDSKGVPLLFNFVIGANRVAPNGSQTCGIEMRDGNPRKFEQTLTKRTGGGAGARGNATTGCLSAATTAFSFSIPYTNPDANGGFTRATFGASVAGVPISTADTTWRDPNWPSSFFTTTTTGPVYGLTKHEELPYYCAIEAADYMRTRFGATIFTIGLGRADAHRTPSGQDLTCNDPLQDPDDQVSRKDFFLTRLAFARSMFTNQLLPVQVRSHYQVAGPQAPRAVTGCADHRLQKRDVNNRLPPSPSVGYISADRLADGNTTFRDLRPPRPASMDTLTPGRRMETQGEYFPTDNANEIPRIFDLIAKTILLRSTS